MRAVRALLATLLVAVGLMISPLTPATRAVAAEPDSLLEIRLDGFSPSLPQRNSEITIAGQATNTSKERLLRPRAYFWRNQAPITDNEGFEQALDSEANDPLGARFIPAFDDLLEDDEEYLEPGDTARFTVKVKVSDLALSPTPGIYLMGVHVLQNGVSPAVGRARVFVPILSEPPRNRLQMTTVVALTSRPSLVSKGVFVDDHLADELAAGGRLDELLRAADRENISFAVDPALIEEVQTMKNGYRVLEEGGTEEGEGRADATRWLDAYTKMAASHDGYRLQFGSVDVAAMAHAGRQDVLEGAEAAAKTVTATASLPLLVWPGDGAADVDTVMAAEALKPAAVLLSDSSTKASAPLLAGIAAPGLDRSKIVNYTSAEFAGGPGPEPSDTPVHLQQRTLAEGWLQAETSPRDATLGRVRLIRTATQAKGDDESVRAPWIQQTTLTQLLRSTPVEWDGVLHYTERNRAKELSPDQLADLDQLSTSWSTWEDLLADRPAARATAAAAIARVASVRGRGQEELFDAFVEPQQREIEQALSQVQISVTRRVLTPKSEVFFPITIRNRLPQSDPADANANTVRVKLVFTSDNRQRLTVQPIGLTSIPAGQNFTGNAVVDAKTNGTVRVTAQLYTASDQPVGRPAIIDVTATQAGTVGWFIAIGAGIVLVGTTALRIRQVTRERARAAAAGDDEPPVDATRSAPPQDVSSDSPGQNTAESIDV